MIDEFVNQVFDQLFVEEFGPESLEKLSPTELVLTKEQDG